MGWFDFRLAYFPGEDALRKEKWEKARMHLEKALQINPASTEAACDLATALWSLGKKEEARKQINDFLQKFPQSLGFLTLGRFLSEENQLDAAHEAFQKAVSLDPKNLDAHYELGKVLLQLNEPEKVFEIFHKVTLNDPFITPFALSRLQEKLRD